MVEVMVALAILAVATTGVLVTILSNTRLTESNHEFSHAAAAARKTLTEMAGSGEFKDIFRRFNADTTDNHGDGYNPGNVFDVVDNAGKKLLNPIAGQAQCGTVIFPMNGTSLREDVVDSAMGLPMDLTGDGVVDANDHKGDYKILPTTARVDWAGFDGQNHRFELRMLVSDK